MVAGLLMGTRSAEAFLAHDARPCAHRPCRLRVVKDLYHDVGLSAELLPQPLTKSLELFPRGIWRRRYDEEAKSSSLAPLHHGEHLAAAGVDDHFRPARAAARVAPQLHRPAQGLATGDLGGDFQGHGRSL